MGEFKYKFEDRYAETQGYDGFTEDQKDLSDYFENHVKPNLRDHEVVGVDSAKQTVFHLCYDCNIDTWNEVYNRMTNIARQSGVKFDFDEFKHLLRFSFLWMPPGGDLVPHAASKFRALSAFNIPLRGTTLIDFYEHFPNGRRGKIVESHHYTNPSFLNVNIYHGVINEFPTERLILKTHLLAVPWEKAIESVESDADEVRLFDFPMPWQTSRVNEYKKNEMGA